MALQPFHFFREDVEQFASKVLGRRLELITVCCHGDRKKFQSVVSCALNNPRLVFATARIRRFSMNYNSFYLVSSAALLKGNDFCYSAAEKELILQNSGYPASDLNAQH